MGVMDKYRRLIANPGGLPPMPRVRYALLGRVGSLTVGIKNDGPAEMQIVSLIAAGNNVNSFIGYLDVGIILADSGELDGIPLPESKITNIVPGTHTVVETGVTVTDAPDFARLYVSANGAAGRIVEDKGSIPPGGIALLDFRNILNVTEYSLIIELEAVAHRTPA